MGPALPVANAPLLRDLVETILMIRRVWSVTDDAWRFQLDIYVGGRRVREGGFITKDDARNAISAIRADYKRGKYQFPGDARKVSLKRVGEAWVAHLKQASRHPAYIRRTEHAFTLLGKLCGADTSVTRVTTGDLERYVAERRSVKPQTIFNDLTTIRAAFRHAAETFPDLQTWRPPKPPTSVRQSRGSRQRILTPDEERRLLSVLRQPTASARERHYIPFRLQTADLVELALHTGMRRNEILTLEWANVHLDRSPGYPHGWILCRATKTGDRAMGTTDDRVIPLSRRASEILTSRKAPGSHVFPATGTNGPKGLSHQTQLHRALKQACKQAKIPYGNSTPGGFVFHDLRHTAATRMLQSGADLRTVMDILGHREVSTALKYAHSTAASRFAAVSGIATQDSAPAAEPKRKNNTAD